MKTLLATLVAIFALCMLGPATRTPMLVSTAFADDDDDDDDDDGRRRRYRFRGKPPAAVTRRAGPNEIVALGLGQRDIARLEAVGFTALGQREIASFGTSLTRLKVPAGRSLSWAIDTVTGEVPGAAVSPNDRYGPLSRVVYEPAGESCGARCEAFELTAWTTAAARCTVRSRIGVVDTAANLSHPAIDGARIKSKVFRSRDRPPSDTLHGTAVLSLLVGAPDSAVVGLAHGAEVFHAEAFHGVGNDSRTDTFDLVAAIDWLITSNVQVLNLSFSGPDNALLQRAVIAAQNKGVHIIAAAGRPDRSKAAGYPARYAGVIAVAAVDGRLRPSRLSTRGSHLAFAAPGVGLIVAHGESGLRSVDGTSFAAPFVAAAYAMSGNRGPGVTRALADGAQDLGASGRDPVYGWGLLQYSAIPGC